MRSHLLYMVLFSGAVGVVVGAMLRRDPRDAARLALEIALGMTGAALAIAWLMYLLHP